MDNLGKLYFRKYYLRMLRLTVYYMLRSLLEGRYDSMGSVVLVYLQA